MTAFRRVVLTFALFSLFSSTLNAREFKSAREFALEFRDLQRHIYSEAAHLRRDGKSERGRNVVAHLQQRMKVLRAAEHGLNSAAIPHQKEVMLETQNELAYVVDAMTTGPEPSIPGGATISGTVTDSQTSAPIQYATVRLFDGQTGYYMRWTYSDATGHYFLPASPGTYRIRVYANSYQRQYRTGIVTSWESPAVADFAMQLGGTIAGKVILGRTNSPSQNGDVLIYDSIGNIATSEYVNWDDGTYQTTDGLASGNYFAVAEDYGSGCESQLYDGFRAPLVDPVNGTPIPVTAGSVTPNIDFTLPPIGAIHGIVREQGSGRPLSGRHVDIGGAWTGTAYTDDNGEFLLPLADGTYYAAVPPQYADGGQIWDHIACGGSCDPLTGTPITVTFGQNSEVTFDLPIVGTPAITGRVVDQQSNQPIAAATVQLFQDGFYRDERTTASDGTYGFYSIQFTGNAYVKAFDAAHHDAMQGPFVLTSTTVQTGVDFSLAPRGRLIGTISTVSGTPPYWTSLDVRDSSGNQVASLSVNSSYAKPLPPGTYHVRAYASDGVIPQLFDNIDCEDPCDFATGTPVTIVDGSDTTANFTLRRYGTIAPTITRSVDGQPITGGIAAYDANGVNVSTATLRAGTHYFKAVAAGYVPQLFNGVACPNDCDPTTGTPVDIQNDTVTNLAFSLDATGGWISGHITDAATQQPVDAQVTIYDAAGTQVETFSATGGAYQTPDPPLPPGNYFAIATAPGFSAAGYSALDCSHGCDPRAGTPIVVTANAVASNIDVALSPLFITAVTPAYVSTTTPTDIVIYGNGFVQGSNVTVGGAAATVVSIQNWQIHAVAPTHAPGKVEVRVVRPDALQAYMPDAVEYVDGALRIPRLVRDIDPRAYTESRPALAILNNRIYFSHASAQVGDELWSGDLAGTSADLVADLTPGPASTSPRSFAVLGSHLYFIATSDAGKRLFATDGTAAGTSTVLDLDPTAAGLQSHGSFLYFYYFNGTDMTIMRSDGSAAGTIAVGTIPGGDIAIIDSQATTYVIASRNGTPSSTMTSVYSTDGTSIVHRFDLEGVALADVKTTPESMYLFVQSSAYNGGAGVYRSDGTAAGTTLVKSFTGLAGGTLFGSQLAIVGSDGTSNGLWVSDGTPAGTTFVHVATGKPVEAAGHVFVVDQEYGTASTLLMSDGTPAGTSVVYTAPAGKVLDIVGTTSGHVFFTESTADLSSQSLLTSDGITTTVVVATHTAEISTATGDLFVGWTQGGYVVSDGSAAGTNDVVVDSAQGSSSPSPIVRAGGKLFMFATAYDGVGLWASDGTESGTIGVSPATASAGSSLTGASTLAYFVASDADHGREVWVSDGTAAGTHMIDDVVPGPGSPFTFAPTIVTIGDTAYVFEEEWTGTALWKTSGTPGSTIALLNKNVVSAAVLYGQLYFIVYESGNYSLWTTDGTIGGTHSIHAFGATNPVSLSSTGSSLAIRVGDALYWSNGSTVWQVATGIGRILGDNQGIVFYVDSAQTALWKTDGSAAGTSAVRQFGYIGSPDTVASARGNFYFVAADTFGPTTLWSSDGTFNGTNPVWPGHTISVQRLANANGTLFMDAGVDGGPYDLWQTDGTDAGTKLAARFGNPGGSWPTGMTQLGDEVYFAATSPTVGNELWALPLDPVATLTSVTPDSTDANITEIPVSVAGTGILPGSRVTIGGSPLFGGAPSGTLRGGLPAGRLYDVAIEEGEPVVLRNAFFMNFYDVPEAHPFHNFVEKLVRHQITAGCGNGNYCVNSAITRGQIASMLLRSARGATYTPPDATGTLFADVPATSAAARWIEELYRSGVTGGCANDPLRYCPANPITRAQMAIFLLRMKEGPSWTPPPASGIFADVPVSSPYAPWIEELYRRGITGGCSISPLQFCPANSTTRGQMAVFLSATFGF